ncbi:MAG: MarR family transcriptional regulator [Actinomycetota bacterium]|nr:MarR family transcriptional regulator [Actinomycetota bacterium]
MQNTENTNIANANSTHQATDFLALDQQVCFALSVASRTVIAVYRPVLEPLGLTHPQYLVMLALWQFAPVSIKDLSEMLQLDPGTLSPLIKRLESARLLRRERDVRDERALAISLTDEGKALRAEAEKVPGAIVSRLGLPVEDLLTLHTTLTKVIAAAREALDSPATTPTASTP